MKTILLFLLVFSGSPQVLDAAPSVSRTSICMSYSENAKNLQTIRQLKGFTTAEELTQFVDSANAEILHAFSVLVIDGFNVAERPEVVEYEVLVQCLAM